MLHREIERNPIVPPLDNEAIKLLTELCFRNDTTPEKADLIFVFGQSIEAESVAGILNALLSKKLAKAVFVSGGVSPEYVKIPTANESEYILSMIDRSRHDDVSFFSEGKSKNMLENVTQALEVLDFRSCNSIIFIHKAHAAGRGYLTLRRFLPKAKLLQQTFEAKYPGAPSPVTRENWHTFDFGRSRVWGEFLRIKRYGQRGDIAYEEVGYKAYKIDQLTGLQE